MRNTSLIFKCLNIAISEETQINCFTRIKPHISLHKPSDTKIKYNLSVKSYEYKGSFTQLPRKQMSEYERYTQNKEKHPINKLALTSA